MKKTSGLILSLLCICFIFFASTVRASEADGDKYMKDKQFHKAITEYDEALKKKPKDADLIVKLARAYDAAAWYGRSVQHWEEYLKQFPSGEYAGEAKRQAAKAHRWIGINFYNNGEDAEKIIRQLEKATELDADLFEAWYWLGRIYMENGQFSKAVDAAKKSLDIKPGDAQAKWMLKEATGKLAKGDAAYSHYVKGYNLYEKKNLDAALAEYRLAVASNEKFVEAWFWIARILMEQKMFADSLGAWNEVLKLDPSNKRAKWFKEQVAALARKK